MEKVLLMTVDSPGPPAGGLPSYFPFGAGGTLASSAYCEMSSASASVIVVPRKATATLNRFRIASGMFACISFVPAGGGVRFAMMSMIVMCGEILQQKFLTTMNFMGIM